MTLQQMTLGTTIYLKIQICKGYRICTSRSKNYGINTNFTSVAAHCRYQLRTNMCYISKNYTAPLPPSPKRRKEHLQTAERSEPWKMASDPGFSCRCRIWKEQFRVDSEQNRIYNWLKKGIMKIAWDSQTRNQVKWNKDNNSLGRWQDNLR